MIDDFKVLLAATVDPMRDEKAFDKVKYPVYISPKLDGIRAHNADGKLYSRKNILLPNLHLQRRFSDHQFADGEFIVGNVTDGDEVYNRTQSGVMTIEGVPDLHYWLFDSTDPDVKDKPFEHRLDIVRKYVAACGDKRVHFVEHELVHNLDQLLEVESRILEAGFEGICGRSPNGIYKYGRSTLPQGILWKLKRFLDEEAQVVGFYEQMTNLNEATINEIGLTKRSSHQENLKPANTLGGFLADYGGEIIRVSCGVLKHSERKYIWEHQDQFINKILKFRHFPHGKKDLPRHPRFVGWRNPMDM